MSGMAASGRLGVATGVFICLAVVACVPHAHAKYVSGSVKLDSENTEAFISKFSFSSGGKGMVHAVFSTAKEHKVSASWQATKPTFAAHS